MDSPNPNQDQTKALGDLNSHKIEDQHNASQVRINTIQHRSTADQSTNPGEVGREASQSTIGLLREFKEDILLLSNPESRAQPILDLKKKRKSFVDRRASNAQIPGLTNLRTTVYSDASYSFESDDDHKERKKTNNFFLAENPFKGIFKSVGFFGTNSEYSKKVYQSCSKLMSNYTKEINQVKLNSGSLSFDITTFELMNQKQTLAEISSGLLTEQPIPEIHPDKVECSCWSELQQSLYCGMKEGGISIFSKKQKLVTQQNIGKQNESVKSLYNKGSICLAVSGGVIYMLELKNRGFDTLNSFSNISPHPIISAIPLDQKGQCFVAIDSEGSVFCGVGQLSTKRNLVYSFQRVGDTEKSLIVKLDHFAGRTHDIVAISGPNSFSLVNRNRRTGKTTITLATPHAHPSLVPPSPFLYLPPRASLTSSHVPMLLLTGVASGLSLFSLPGILDELSVVVLPPLLPPSTISNVSLLGPRRVICVGGRGEVFEVSVTSISGQAAEEAEGLQRARSFTIATQQKKKITRKGSGGDPELGHKQRPEIEENSQEKRSWGAEIGKWDGRALVVAKAEGGVYLLTEKGPAYYGLRNWVEFLDEAIREGMYILALKAANAVADKDIDKFSGIPESYSALEEELVPRAKILFTKIIASIDSKNIEMANVSAKVSMLLMMKLGMLDFMLEDFKNIMIALDFVKPYYLTLIMFYESSLLPILSEEQINEILKVLEDEPIKRKKFIYFLFQKGQKKDLIKQDVLEKQDFNMMLFLGKSKDRTLLVELFKSLENELNNPVLSDPSQSIYKIFWILNDLLLSDSNNESKNRITSEFSVYAIDWIFSKNTLTKLSSLDSNSLLESIYFMFSRYLIKRLEEYSNRLRKPDPISEQVLDLKSNPHLASIFSTLNDLSISSGQVKKFYFFVLISVNRKDEKCRIHIQFARKIILYIARNFKELEEDQDSITNADYIAMQLFLLFLDYKESLTADEELFEVIKNGHKTMQLMFHDINQNYKQIISLYQRLISDNAQWVDNLFIWIKHNLQNQKTKAAIYDLMVKEQDYLVGLNQQKFGDLLQVMDIEEQMQFVLKIGEKSHSKLVIFKRIIDFVQKKHLEAELTNSFKIEYIRLLSHFERTAVLKELHSGKYPASECLEVCESYKNELAIAYLKERLGNSSEALKIYKRRLKKARKALIVGERYNDEFYGPKLLERVGKEFKLAIEVCKSSETPEAHLLELLEFIVKTEARYPPLRIRPWDECSDIASSTYLEMVKGESIINQLENNLTTEIVHNTRMMTKITNHFKNLRNMFSTSKDVNFSDFWDFNEILLAKVKSPKFLSHEKKNIIKKSLGDSLMVFDRCQHYYNVIGNTIPNEIIFCNRCEEEVDAEKCLNDFLRTLTRNNQAIFGSNFEGINKAKAVDSNASARQSNARIKTKFSSFDYIQELNMNFYYETCDELQASDSAPPK